LYPAGQYDLISKDRTVYSDAKLTHGPAANCETVNLGMNASITVNNKTYAILWFEGSHNKDVTDPDDAALNK
jgi:hypothetical protein